jgi:hypothetical protein
MKISNLWWERSVACGIALLLAAPMGLAATGPLPDAPQPATSGTAARSLTNSSTNGSSQGPAQEDYSSSLLPAQTGSVAPATPPSQSAPANQQNAPQQPVGTAAAPYVRPEGVPASRPAGAAIAPAKQRRVRIYAIRIALLAGAAIAIGTVVAASEGSPARP